MAKEFQFQNIRSYVFFFRRRDKEDYCDIKDIELVEYAALKQVQLRNIIQLNL